MRSSVLIIDKMHSSIQPLLEEMGLKVDYRPEIQRAELIEILASYQGLIVRSKTRIDQEVLSRANQLKFIARAGSGLDLIDTTLAQQQKISVFNAPEGNRDAVAEHTLGMILSLLHKIFTAHLEVKNYQWNREANRGRELKNKTVSIVGYGNIGREVARRLSHFGCQVLAFDKYKVSFSDQYAREASMAEIFRETDVLSLHIPLNDQSRHLVNEKYLHQFHKNILLVNTARGELVDLVALRWALDQGKIWGAALDVLENEKLNTLTPTQKETFDYLTSHPQVIITPHVAGWTQESYERINQVLAEKIRQCLY